MIWRQKLKKSYLTWSISMEILFDHKKKNLYDGFVKNYPDIPKWIIYRTLELASTPGKAFDALCDFDLSILPASWDFQTECWKPEKGFKF